MTGWKSDASTCLKGHPLTLDNVIVTKSGRRCRECKRLTAERAKQRSLGRLRSGEYATCPHGHLLTPENSYANGACIACCRPRSRDWQRANRIEEGSTAFQQRTACLHGHPRTPENTTPQNTCAICKRDAGTAARDIQLGTAWRRQDDPASCPRGHPPNNLFQKRFYGKSKDGSDEKEARYLWFCRACGELSWRTLKAIPEVCSEGHSLLGPNLRLGGRTGPRWHCRECESNRNHRYSTIRTLQALGQLDVTSAPEAPPSNTSWRWGFYMASAAQKREWADDYLRLSQKKPYQRRLAELWEIDLDKVSGRVANLRQHGFLPPATSQAPRVYATDANLQQWVTDYQRVTRGGARRYGWGAELAELWECTLSTMYCRVRKKVRPVLAAAA